MNRTMRMALGAVVAASVAISAQWPVISDPTVPRDAQGKVNVDAPTPRTPDGKPDLSGIWMRAESGPPNQGRGRGRGGRDGAPPAGAGREGTPPAAAGAAGAPGQPAGGPPGGNTSAVFGGGRGGVTLEPQTTRFAFDPNGPPVATFFEAGGNITGGLPYTPWAAEIRKQRFDVNKAKDNPDANCMPMGFLQFHQQPQPRKIIQTPQLVLIEYEANYGLRHIYIDGRPLPPQ